MSQIQIQKPLTFEQICPLWFTALTGGGKSQILNWADFRHCMVGEAYGFDKSYINPTSSLFCKACAGFAGLNGCMEDKRTLLEILRHEWISKELNNEPTVQEFVKHWNECHVK